ncbi:MAG: hypothetical protein WB611_10860 [Stellaceae bacterium]
MTDAQKNLLTVLPADLVTEAKDCYEQCVRAAPWLQPIDRNGIIVYAHAVATESMAGRELDRCIKDPQFVDPKSEASEAAKLYLRIVTRQAALIAQWSDLLGFNPRARARIGIAVVELPPEDNPNDPWEVLRLLPGGKADQPHP